MSAEEALAAQVRGQVLAGVYRHYKGPLYLVLGLGHDANTEGRVGIVYVALQTDGARTGPAIAFRDREDFESWLVLGQPGGGHRPGEFRTLTAAEVDRLGTKVVREQGYVPRFEYVGPERPIGR